VSRKAPKNSSGPLYSPSYPTTGTLAKSQRRRRRNIIIISLIICLLIAGTYFELQHLETHSISVFALLNLNIILLLLLLFLIFRNLIKLVIERKQREFGSRFKTRLVFAFVALALVPSGFLLFVGSNLMADSIRNWFNPEMEQFVNDAMEVARNSHAFSEDFTLSGARTISQLITKTSLLRPEARNDLEKFLQEKQAEYRLLAIQLFDNIGLEIWRSSQKELPSGVFFSKESAGFKDIQEGKEFSAANSLGPGEIIQKGVPVFSLSNSDQVEAILVVNLYLPQDLWSRVRSIQRNYEAYKQQKLAIRPTQGLYISVFVTMALTILFAAIWLGLYIARQISIPISHLDQATHEVARGNLDFKLDVLAYDEIGGLVKSFNQMTEQLRENRNLIETTTEEVRKTNMEIVKRRNQLETILQNIGAGVISIDLEGRITTINHKAGAIFNLSEIEALGANFHEILKKDALTEFVELLERVLRERLRGLQKEIQIQTNRRITICSVSFAPLWDAADNFCGVVAVLDDLTQFIRIQRIAAWREVARRLAHEIKNPLTPIQLHAQRIQKKFQNASPDFPEVFHDATTSIINEVNGIRTLLDEFSQFARLPEAFLRPSDLHEIINQTLVLYSGTHDGLTIEEELDPDLPQMMLDAEQIKRVFINLIDNAIEAMHGKGTIRIKTEFEPALQLARIHISDEGPGVAVAEREKIFLPHFSTKERGSGLGLAICYRIISDHDGNIKVTDNEPRGARFVIELPVYSDASVKD
jgi:two-component system, NtrC family, nitrogen regulation sensor histidine kinase NtrY